MNIGQLRHGITFKRATEAQNAVGEPIVTYAAIASTRARVEPTAGKERFAALQVQGEQIFNIICRYQTALSTLQINDRITWGSVDLDIQSIANPDGRNRVLNIIAKRHL